MTLNSVLTFLKNTFWDINFTPSVQIKISYLPRLAGNDVRVTSCPADFDGKQGSARIALLDAVFKFEPISLDEMT